MSKIYTMQGILEDHKHYSRMERIYALFCIDYARKTVITSGNPFLYLFQTDNGEDIHESLGRKISAMYDKTVAMEELKAKHPEIPDEDIPYYAERAMEYVQKGMKISAIKFDLLVLSGELKPSKN